MLGNNVLFLRATSFFLMFIFIFDRERDRAWAREGQREGETQEAPSCQHRAGRGAWTHEPWDHDLSQSWTLNQLSYPGAPSFSFLIVFFLNPYILTDSLIIFQFLPFSSIHYLKPILVPKSQNICSQVWVIRKEPQGRLGGSEALSFRLRLRSWPHSLWVGAPHQALC